MLTVYTYISTRHMTITTATSLIMRCLQCTSALRSNCPGTASQDRESSRSRSNSPKDSRYTAFCLLYLYIPVCSCAKGTNVYCCYTESCMLKVSRSLYVHDMYVATHASPSCLMCSGTKRRNHTLTVLITIHQINVHVSAPLRPYSPK